MKKIISVIILTAALFGNEEHYKQGKRMKRGGEGLIVAGIVLTVISGVGGIPFIIGGGIIGSVGGKLIKEHRPK